MNSIYSVGQVNTYIKNMFDQDFMLKRIYIKVKYPTVNTILPDIFIFL